LTYENDIKNIQEKLEKSIEKQDYFLAAELKKQLEELKRSMKNVKNKNSLPVHLRPEVTREDI
jgi:protein-arginine kinase activator protein McsA